VERLSELESEKPHEQVVGRTVGANNDGIVEDWEERKNGRVEEWKE